MYSVYFSVVLDVAKIIKNKIFQYFFYQEVINNFINY